MQNESHPFSIQDIRDFVPVAIRPWVLVAFLLVYQLSGGVYLAVVAEMSSGLALLHEDIFMAGYASLVGMALTFTVMYRLKFRFSIKTSLTITAIGLIICNLICVTITNVPLLVLVSFVSGIFRMWGTFACNTTIQLWITPKRDMAVWFCYIYLVVQGAIQLSGLVTIYISFLTTWQYVHWLVIGLLLIVLFLTYIIFRHYRSMPKLPLYGIDWLGGLLWGVTILCVIFVLNYGEHYDWFDSIYIVIGTVFGVVSLALNIWRASFIRHPFIANKTWTYRHVWLTFILYIVIDILMSPSHLFEHIYAETILGYDSLNVISFNWIILAGIVLSASFCYLVFAIRKWTYRRMTIIGFSLMVGYLMSMYLLIDYNLPKEMLLFPLFLRAFGYEIIAIVFITSLSVLPFQHFFQSLSVQAFISACCGALLGEVFLNQVFKFTLKKNSMLLGANLDNLNGAASHVPFEALYGLLQKQAILVSMKEIYGFLTIAGLGCILLFLLYQSNLRPNSFHPKFSTMRKVIKHQLRMENHSVR